MKIWSTKYCLTEGITEHDVPEPDGGRVVTGGRYILYLHGEGRDWHKSEGAAIERAYEIKTKKLKSLSKQIKKVKAIEFNHK